MTRTCCLCRHWSYIETDPEMGQVGECLLARKWGGKVIRPWGYDACKSFEKREERKK